MGYNVKNEMRKSEEQKSEDVPKILVDANVLLDVLQKREPHFQNSSIIWKACETEKAIGYVSTLTIANLIYVMKSELDQEKIEKVLEKMSLIFKFADFKAADLSNAAKQRWKDFEDAVQFTIALRLGMDFIVTRNVKDFKASSISVVTPAEFVARLKET